MMRRLILALAVIQASHPAATASDHPGGAASIDGIWSFATLTPFERPAELASKPYFTDEEAATFVKDTLARNDRDRRDGGAATDAARGVADFWFDRGTGLAVMNGRKLTSLVVDPPDGRVPALTAAARAKVAARNADNRERPADGPENRSLQERCLSFNAGPPINLGPYNNYVRLFEMPKAVVIFTEMIHDARIVWMDGRPHLPPHVKLWLGDSRGRWDGNTLVVDTTNYNDKGWITTAAAGGRIKGIRQSESLHVVERFTRIDRNTIDYQATIDDPKTFLRPWTVAIPLHRNPNYRLYEYACHEGNRAVEGVLRGARAEEKNK